ncbi:hypothetical protein HZH68_007891 [Vespula germanica]|uniref:Defensin n=1 Tax=Vespula germanica TaxID=30212 RepID=A0A834K6M5_VESGE|nr:hypothetical protein HZH68_007891 [Vespula germanica]
MAKIYFLAFLALLVFIAVSAQEEQDKGPALDINEEEYRGPCSTGGNALCNRYCKIRGSRFGSCTSAKKCLCFT